jgi:hypothetical protein
MTYCKKLFLGIVYQGQLYIADSSDAEYFDPSTNIWTPWPAYPTELQSDACLILWQNSFLLIDSVNLQTYNMEMETWTSTLLNPPSAINNPACLTLRNNKVLIVGSGGLPLLYDPSTNLWQTLPATINTQGKVTLLQLGPQYFIFGGNSTAVDVQEFHHRSNTWSSVSGGPLLTTNNQGYISGVAVPNVIFADILGGGCTGGILGRKQEETNLKKLINQ